MAGVQVVVKLKDTLTPALRKLAKSVKDWRTFWPIAIAAIHKGEAELFRQNGPGWPPLSQVTIDRRRKGRGEGDDSNRSAGSQILRDSRKRRTAALFAMASVTGAPGSSGTEKQTQMDLRIGTNLEYAAAHQFGLGKRAGWVPDHTATRRKGKTKGHSWLVQGHITKLPAVPARPFIRFSDNMIKNLRKGARTSVRARWLERQFEEGAATSA